MNQLSRNGRILAKKKWDNLDWHFVGVQHHISVLASPNSALIATQLFLPLPATVYFANGAAMQHGEFLQFGIETEVLLTSCCNTPAMERPENIPEISLNAYKASADLEWPWTHLDMDGSYSSDATDEWSLTGNVTIVPGEGQSTTIFSNNPNSGWITTVDRLWDILTDHWAINSNKSCGTRVYHG